MPYSIFEHRHRFSAWAAARAAQVRSGVKVRDFREALEKSGLTEFLKEPASKHVTQDGFEELHRVKSRTFCKKCGMSQAAS
jgi:hypothetical protein